MGDQYNTESLFFSKKPIMCRKVIKIFSPKKTLYYFGPFKDVSLLFQEIYEQFCNMQKTLKPA